MHIFIVPSPFGTALLYKIHRFTHGKAPDIPPKAPCPGPPSARLQTVSSGLSLPVLIAHTGTANALLVAPGAPHETETRLIDGRLLRVYKNQWPSLRVFWLWALSQHKDAVYLVYEDQSYTFGQVHIRAVKAASVLRHVYGVQKGSHQLPIYSMTGCLTRAGDRIAICARNYPEYIVAFWACRKLLSNGSFYQPYSPCVRLHWCGLGASKCVSAA